MKAVIAADSGSRDARDTPEAKFGRAPRRARKDIQSKNFLTLQRLSGSAGSLERTGLWRRFPANSESTGKTADLGAAAQNRAAISFAMSGPCKRIPYAS